MEARGKHSKGYSKVLHFEVLPFTRTANGAVVNRLRKCSMGFKKALLAGDTEAQMALSRDAWATMHDLTLLIRKAEDNGAAAPGVMPSSTGWIVEDLSTADRQSMMSQAKVERRHSQAKQCPLRKCLNKLAHPTATTFRVDGRKAHFIVLTGPDQSRAKGPWVCEFNINTFATDCAKVIGQFA